MQAITIYIRYYPKQGKVWVLQTPTIRETYPYVESVRETDDKTKAMELAIQFTERQGWKYKAIHGGITYRKEYVFVLQQ